MIISSNLDTEAVQFEELLDSTSNTLKTDADSRPDYYIANPGTRLEKIVFEIMSEKARGSVFEGTLELKSGAIFPDIIAKQYWGLEVKSSLKNHWKTTGNSILESTRVDDVKRIYLLFGKLCKPVRFRYKRYEECLHSIAVTHSPRYLIDMDTQAGKTIFDLIGMPYEELRNQEKPIKTILNYYRQLLKPGDDLWWLDTGETEQPAQNIAVRRWGNLTISEKNNLRNKAMALFPIIFSKSPKKYSKLATWLVAANGVLAPSLRDTFSAGGRINLTIMHQEYRNVPRIFQWLQKNVSEVIQIVNGLDISDAEYYWETQVPETGKLDIWISLVKHYSTDIMGDCQLDVEELIREQI